jgi:hypothetical protein
LGRSLKWPPRVAVGKAVGKAVVAVSGADEAKNGRDATIGRDLSERGCARVVPTTSLASADVLLLLLGFGRRLWGFRNGRDVLLVVRHRG